MEIYEQNLTLNEEESHHKVSLCLINGSLPALKNHYFSLLHPNELSYFSTLKYEKRQHSYLLGRYAAKHAIASYCKIRQLNTIYIESGIFQQPIAYYPKTDKIQITLSHCNQLGIALAFPETLPMGVDIEEIDFTKISVIQNQMTLEENALAHSLKINLSDAYTILWTVKEALSKALRTGLTISLESLAITNVQARDDFYISEFKHLPQYNAFSFYLGKYIISIVYPKKTPILINIKEIQQWFHRHHFLCPKRALGTCIK